MKRKIYCWGKIFFPQKNEPDEAELVAEKDEAAAAALANAPGRGLVSDWPANQKRMVNNFKYFKERTNLN